MDMIDQAIEILRLSADGKALSPGDLEIVQAAVNVLRQIHEQIAAGEYTAELLCGVPHLTRDHQGYVYWKGQCVEHFSHASIEAMREAALKLAANCQVLESKGFPVNSRTAISRDVLEAPADTPWIEALCHYYSFFEKDGVVRAILFKHGKNPPAVVLEKRDGATRCETYPSAYDAYHELRAQGYVSAGTDLGYEQVAALLERTALTPEDIHAALI